MEDILVPFLEDEYMKSLLVINAKDENGKYKELRNFQEGL
jgi:hypothetical protein